MRLRRAVIYTHLLYLTAIVSIVPGIVAFDRILGYPIKENVTPQARAVAERVFNAIYLPPESLLRMVGFNSGSHAVQLWPPGWPYVSAFALRSFLICFPFWSILGILAVELAVLVAKRLSRLRATRPTAKEPA